MAKKRKRRSERADDEQSMAELMIEAELDRAMGEPVDDWLLDMLPDEEEGDGE